MGTVTKTVLTQNERWTILNALTTAAQVADADAEMLTQAAEALRNGQEIGLFAKGEAGARAADALARQHTRNAADYRAMWGRLQDAAQITLTPEEED